MGWNLSSGAGSHSSECVFAGIRVSPGTSFWVCLFFSHFWRIVCKEANTLSPIPERTKQQCVPGGTTFLLHYFFSHWSDFWSGEIQFKLLEAPAWDSFCARAFYTLTPQCVLLGFLLISRWSPLSWLKKNSGDLLAPLKRMWRSNTELILLQRNLAVASQWGVGNLKLDQTKR